MWKAGPFPHGTTNLPLEKNLGSLQGLAFEVRAILLPFSWTQPCRKLRLLHTFANAGVTVSPLNQPRIILQPATQLFYHALSD